MAGKDTPFVDEGEPGFYFVKKYQESLVRWFKMASELEQSHLDHLQVSLTPEACAEVARLIEEGQLSSHSCTPSDSPEGQ